MVRNVRSAVLLLIALMVLSVSGCQDANKSNDAAAVASAAQCSYPADGEPVRAVDPPAENNVLTEGSVEVTLKMTAGDVKITMNRAATPCTVNSFLSLAEQGFYDNTECHRLVDTGIFILQCGDPSSTGRGGPGYTIPDELTGKETYPRGTVAMANRGVENTGGSQFFLVWADTPLKPEYTVLGRMDEASIDVIGGIAAQGVDATQEPMPIAEAHITEVVMG